jgi:hypothetical protein
LLSVLVSGPRAVGICPPPVRGKVQLIVLVSALGLAAPEVPRANAAQYGVVTCAGQAAGLGGWSGFTRGSHPAKLQETCATGGVMYSALQGNVATSPGDAGWGLTAPAGTSIAAVTLVRKLAIAGTGYTYTARAMTPVAANTQKFEACTGPAGCKDEIARTSFAWRSPRTDVNRLEVYVSCVPAANTPCQKVSGAEAAAVRISRADITLNDTTAPVISSGPSSAMFGSSAPVSGVQSIAASFTDSGGGIASTGVQVDGQTVGEVPVSSSSCRTPYRRLAPCPRSLPTTLRFNPAAVPDGPHQIRVFARDATGANVGYSNAFAVTTSARGTINGTNGSDQARVTVGVRRAVSRGRHAPEPHSTITVPYNAKTVAEGRLLNSARQPIAGARLTVATAVDRGAPVYADLATGVVTDSRGRFKVTLARGPSRRVRVLYFARALDTTPAGRDDARVKIRTHATFSARHRHVHPGHRAVFRGHIVGSFRPAGIRVELQGRRGRSYVTLASAATRPDGSYRVSYRFTRGARGRYVFRLRVRHFPRFPYFLGYSRPVNVFVQ